MKTLIIMNYNAGTIEIYPAKGYITDDTIEELGYNLDEVSWMVTENTSKDLIIYHNKTVK